MSNFDDEMHGTTFGDYQDDERQGDGLVRLQWRQGDPKANTGGYFFLSMKNVPEGFAPNGDSWQTHEEYFENTRTRDQGWKSTALPMMIICARGQVFVRPPDGSKQGKIWLDRWDASRDCAQHVDLLLIADGLQELGPVCWSTNSTTVAFAIISGADPKRNPAGGILHRIREEVLGAADRASKVMQNRKAKKLYWLFWITIASQTDAKGKPVFTPTAGKDVTLPAPVLPATVDTKWLSAAYVGKEMAEYGESMRGLFDEWRLTKFTNDPVPATAAQPEPTARTNGRNVPESIEDLPF